MIFHLHQVENSTWNSFLCSNEVSRCCLSVLIPASLLFSSSFIHIVIFIYRKITKEGTETMLQGIQAAQPVVQGGGIQPAGDGQIWLACDAVQQPKCLMGSFERNCVLCQLCLCRGTNGGKEELSVWVLNPDGHCYRPRCLGK